MSNRYSQKSSVVDSATHFSQAMSGEVEMSRMKSTPVHLTTFNAGDIIPIGCYEVLPRDVFDFSVDEVIRQTTLLTPTMGSMHCDIYAFFVPNRIVNQSWKAVTGENYSGSWIPADVSLAPLWSYSSGGAGPASISIPVGSVADYYGFPTQQPIPTAVLSQCHDLKFRGYVMIYNEYFRDQNYQPPIPMSLLNVYEGFFASAVSDVTYITSTGTSSTSSENVGITPYGLGNGSFGAGSLGHAVNGGKSTVTTAPRIPTRLKSTIFDALGKPLKANKCHDYFTSVLPSPQKGQSVFVPVSFPAGSVLPVYPQENENGRNPGLALRWARAASSGIGVPEGKVFLGIDFASQNDDNGSTYAEKYAGDVPSDSYVYPTNLAAEINSDFSGSLSVSDLRMSAAIQQVYEQLARSGSRYREYIRGFFGLEVEDPFLDIPRYLGHIRRDLDLYQTAQTSASQEGSTAQGNLAAFGYTSSGGHLFRDFFYEHGYVHIFAVVRHKNVYSSFLSRDNFRLNMLDFYQPPLANISEQPVYTREINPFLAGGSQQIFGYQEAWAEYRYDPDYVTGYMRPGISGSLRVWNYADEFDSTLAISDGDWLKSNSEEVLNKTLAVDSSVAPQFKAAFTFSIIKERPMPTYSVPGLDII